MKTDVYIELADEKTNCNTLVVTAREIWKSSGNKMKDLESLELFYKPDEKKCYYVFNGDITGKFDV